jgi:virulence-associated protein VagC
MKTRVTEQGIIIPRDMLEGLDEVEIRKQDGMIIIVPAGTDNPIFNIGKNPIDADVTDASVNHDYYVYRGE